MDFTDVALREDAVEVADGAAEYGGSIFPGEEPVEVELDSLAVGNQKDVDVLLKEQKPPENVLKEGLVVCFGVAIVRANINTMSGTFKKERKILDYKYLCFMLELCN